MSALYGLIEAGGTKFVLGLASEDREILEETRVATTTPDETLTAALGWMRGAAQRRGALKAIGVASFGPIEIDRAAANWGSILKTPKPGWSGAAIVEPFASAFRVPMACDTDVNAAALAESRWGAARGARSAVYLTIGTGIGGGAVIDGKTLSGLGHPEMGHMRVARHAGDAAFSGNCPFHGDCVEGLASGPAILRRWGANLSDLPADHVAHDVTAFYLAQACTSLQAFMEPERILLGGGVMDTPGLLARVRQQAAALGAGYFRGVPDKVIAAPGLAPRSGLLGALALAMDL